MINIIADISSDPMVFDVTIEEENGTTQHKVTLLRETYTTIFGQSHEPIACVEAAFRFLLEREPKEAIMTTFDITVISMYFPEFSEKITSYLK